jgi:hypothetical protein
MWVLLDILALFDDKWMDVTDSWYYETENKPEVRESYHFQVGNL